jgi:hypothetical protein
MPRPRRSARPSQLDAAGRQSARYCELQIDWVRYKSGTPIARFGGLWDREEKCYAGDAKHSRVIEVHAAQIEAITLFDEWMVDHLQGGSTEVNDRIREVIQQDLEFDAELGALLGLSEMFLTGGRRSGKTVIMEGILNSYAVASSGSIVWTVTPVGDVPRGTEERHRGAAAEGLVRVQRRSALHVLLSERQRSTCCAAATRRAR